MLWLIVLLLAISFASTAFRVLRRRAAKKRAKTPDVPGRCRCGYILNNLDRIRCPECGRVFGFDATPEDLGLTDEELRRASEARERRRQALLKK